VILCYHSSKGKISRERKEADIIAGMSRIEVICMDILWRMTDGF